MLKEALPFIKEIKVINYDPSEQVSFRNQFIQGKMLKSNERVSTLFIGECIISGAKIPAHGTINSSLLLNCEVENLLTKYSAPVVSIRKCRIIDGKGEYQKVSNSFVENSQVKILGKSDGTIYKNCTLSGGSFQSCKFINCIITDCNLTLCEYDNKTIIGEGVNEIGKKKEKGFYNIGVPRSIFK